VPIDAKSLLEDPSTLKQMLIDVTAQLDKTNKLLRQLLEAKHHVKSEQLSPDQLQLFMEELKRVKGDSKDDDELPPLNLGDVDVTKNSAPRGRRPLSPHLKRQRIEHDLTETEKYCADCRQPLHLLGEESSERYEYIPAQFLVTEDVCKKYACDCTVRTATKPPQPIAKSSAGASLSVRSPITCRCTARRRFSNASESTSRTRPWADGCASRRSCSRRCMTG
jgi:hypothetical protein